MKVLNASMMCWVVSFLLSFTILVNGSSVKRQESRFCNEKINGMFANPQDCTKFYHCSNGNTYIQNCPAGLHFNSKISGCDWPANVQCTPVTTSPSMKKSTTKKTMTSPPMKKSTTKKTMTSPPMTKPTTKETMTSPPNIISTTQKPTTGSGCKRVVCYFVNWAQYRSGDAKQLPKDVDAHMCTHIIFAFAKLTGNKLAPTEPNDEMKGSNVGNYRKITALKKKNQNLKVLLAVGGYNVRSLPFTAMVATQRNRKEFIDSSITFLRDRGFDGLDIDWEFPTKYGSPPIDKNRFSDLLRELKAAFTQEASSTSRPRLLLTAAVSAGKWFLDTAYDIPVLNSELDFINLMAYDMLGFPLKKTGHHSALLPASWDNPTLNVKWAADYWIKNGASPGKLVIGVPFYAKAFTLVSASNNKPGAAVSGLATAGKYTRQSGTLSYYEVCDMISRGAIKRFDKEQKAPYIVHGNQWAGYDNPKSLKNKVKYILDNNYGGVMVWDLSFDDIKGSFCGNGRYPLMAAINNACKNNA